MNIIDYVEKVRKAYADNDKDRAKEIQEEYGQKEATYQDVEEATAYTIQLLSAVIDTHKTFLNFKLDSIVDMLKENEVLPEESIDNLDENVKNILEKIEKAARENE